jgi:hypothetical protein
MKPTTSKGERWAKTLVTAAISVVWSGIACAAIAQLIAQH